MKSPLPQIASDAADRAASQPALMHDHPVIARLMQQLHDAAIKDEATAKTFVQKHMRGFFRGRADAKRHMISVLAQTKVD